MSTFDFFADMNAIYRRDDLSATERHLAIVVLSFRNRKTGACNPPVISERVSAKTGQITESLVSRSGLCERAVRKTLAALEAKKVFIRTPHQHAPADFFFVESAGAPCTTCTPAPDAGLHHVHPTLHHVQGSPAPRAPQPCTTCTQTANKQQINNKEEQRESSALSDAHSSTTFSEIDPPFDETLFGQVAQGPDPDVDLPPEPSEPASLPEDVFSPDAQIPIENIDARFATASDSIFGTDTPPKDQNAAERKSEAISKPKRKRVSSSVVKDKPEDISQEVWDDWLTTRRAKRLPLTQTALNSVRREAASAGLTFQAAVTFAVEQGWAAFRAEWYRNATRKGDSTKTNARYLTAQERYEERMRKAGEMSDEEYFAQFDLPEEILNYEKAQEAKRHVAS